VLSHEISEILEESLCVIIYLWFFLEQFRRCHKCEIECFPLTGGGFLSVYFNFREDPEWAEMTPGSSADV